MGDYPVWPFIHSAVRQMGPIAWLTILHTYFIGLLNNFSAELKIKGQMYKEASREGCEEQGEKRGKVMNRSGRKRQAFRRLQKNRISDTPLGDRVLGTG